MHPHLGVQMQVIGLLFVFPLGSGGAVGMSIIRHKEHSFRFGVSFVRSFAGERQFSRLYVGVRVGAGWRGFHLFVF